MNDRPPGIGVLYIAMQLQGTVTVDQDGKNAKGRWHGFMIEARPTAKLHGEELRQTWGHGVYENEYVKEDGKWKIKKLHCNLTFRTPYEDGWLKTPIVDQHGPDSVVPPDEPCTAYNPYPSGYHLPCYFKHPVTGD